MPKVAIILLAGTETRADKGRMYNAFVATQEMLDAGDDVTLVLDGAGVQWVAVLTDPESKYHEIYNHVRPVIAGACSYCVSAYGEDEAIETSGLELLDDYDEHPSVRRLIVDGYTVITF